MSLERLPSGRWRATVKHGGQRVRTRSFPTREEARAAEATALLALMETARSPVRRRPAKVRTVDELVGAHLEQADLTEQVAAAARVARSRLPEWFLAMPVADVTPGDVEAVYAHVGRLWRPSAVLRVVDLLGGAFRRAVRWQWCRSNPVHDAQRPRRVEREMDPPDPSLLARLIAAAPPEFAVFLRLAAATGARRGELMGLRWGDIDLEQATVRIERGVVQLVGGVVVARDTKTGKGGRRTVAVDAGTVAALRRWRTEAGGSHLARVAPGSYLFGFVDRPRAPDWASYRWRCLCAEVGVEGVRLHDVRHMHASELLAAGIDAVAVAGRLGHRSARTTLAVYAHALPARDRAAADVIGERLG